MTVEAKVAASKLVDRNRSRLLHSWRLRSHANPRPKPQPIGAHCNLRLQPSAATKNGLQPIANKFAMLGCNEWSKASCGRPRNESTQVHQRLRTNRPPSTAVDWLMRHHQNVDAAPQEMKTHWELPMEAPKWLTTNGPTESAQTSAQTGSGLVVVTPASRCSLG
jgi:hypothetical protein